MSSQRLRSQWYWTAQLMQWLFIACHVASWVKTDLMLIVTTMVMILAAAGIQSVVFTDANTTNTKGENGSE